MTDPSASSGFIAVPPDSNPQVGRTADDAGIALLELKAVMRSGKGFSLPYLFIGICMAVVMAPAVPAYALALWCCAYLVYIAARHMATLEFHKDPLHATPARLAFWRHWVMKSGATHGVVIGSPALMALPQLPQMQQFLLIWIMFAVCGGAAIFAASLWQAVRLLLVVAIVPYAVVLAVISPQLALFLVGTGIFCSYMGRHHHRALVEGFALVVRNEALAEELTRKNRALTASNQSKTAVIADASQELRQPVHALELAVASLDAPLAEDELQGRLQALRSPVGALSQMLTDLADLGRLEAQQMPVGLEAVSIETLLDAIVQEFTPQAVHKGLALEVEACSLAVQSDPELLRLMASHLVANAIRYTAAGTVRVACEADGSDAVLRITDTGFGMARQTLEALADSSFVRLDDSRASGLGLGIGLAIVRSSAALLGHRVHASSAPGRGTTVSLHLPLLDAPPVVPTVAPALASQGQRIAVLESDALALRGLCSLLEQWGFRTAGGTTLEDLQEALESWDGARPQLFICDLQRDAAGSVDAGFQAAWRLRRIFDLPELPTLLLSDSLDAVVALRADGENMLLAHKPIGPQRLVRLLASALQTPAHDSK